MSGGHDRSDETNAQRADGGNAPPSDGNAQPRAGQGQAGYARGGGGIDFERYGKLGSAIYGTVGLGLALTLFLFSTMADGGANLASGALPSSGAGDELFGAVLGSFVFMLILGPFVATALGVFVSPRTETHESGPVVGAVTSAIGATVTMVVLVILMMVFAPGPFEVGDLIAPLIGGIIGIAATGAGGAFAAEKLPDL